MVRLYVLPKNGLEVISSKLKLRKLPNSCKLTPKCPKISRKNGPQLPREDSAC